jgi:hypothetical protein
MPSNLFVRTTLEISDLSSGKVTAIATFIDNLMDRIEALEAAVKIHSIDFHKIVPLEARVAELENRPSEIDNDDRFDGIQERLSDVERLVEGIPSEYDLDNQIEEKIRELVNDATISISL